MNFETTSSSNLVLLIGPRTATDSMGAESSRAVSIEQAPDVYRGLAKLLGEGGRRFVGAVVALECVGSREFEFFKVLAKARPELKVLVHAEHGYESKVARAIDAGASGALSPDSWRELASLVKVDEPVVLQAPAEPEPKLEGGKIDEVQEQEGSEDSSVRLIEESEDPVVESEVDDGGGSARVPWLRYTESPQRTAPPKRQPPAPESHAPVPDIKKPPTPSDYEPLLTDEEIEALMADDISAIAPKVNQTWRPSSGAEGGRS